MSRQVVIHIGLHKTGTRFLQRMVFRQLDPAGFNVNPKALLRPIQTAIRDAEDAARTQPAREAVALWRAGTDERTLVISEPHISGDMYSSHQDYRQNLALMHELFPEARIVFFVRKQSDWLQSAYRQALAKGHAVPIQVFLNFYNGEFRSRLDRRIYGSRNVEALTLRFLDIYRAYAKAYGEERVLLLRQEDMRKQTDTVKQRLAEVLGLPKLPEAPGDRSQNRSYSALAICLFHPSVLLSWPVPGPDDVGRRPRRIYWLIRPLLRIRRALIQHVFDRIFYKDWDLLAKDGIRERIEAHYANEDEEIKTIAERCLQRGVKSASPGEGHQREE